MVDYNIVKHCWLCKQRFVVNKSEARKHYCNGCQIKVDKAQKEEEPEK